MTVYSIAQITIHDRARYQGYMARFLEVLDRSGGRLLVADDAPEVREGSFAYEKVIVMAFDSRAALERWAASDEYAALARERQAASEGVVVVVRGLPRAHP